MAQLAEAAVNYVSFAGGVDAQAAPYLLAEDKAKDSRNFHTTALGSLRKREGFEIIADTTDITTLDSIHSLFPVNTTTKTLLAAGKQASASNDRLISISTAGVASTLKSTLTLGKRWEWAQAPTSGGQGPIYGVNGTDTPQYWDGTAGSTSNWTASTGTVPSSARFLIYHADRLWATGSESIPGRVWYSGLTASAVPGPDPRNWDTDGYVDIEPQDGEIITGIGEIGPYIVVFKPHRTYVITDPVTGAWRQISNTIGCAAHRSIVQTAAGTFFLSEDAGVCVTDGQKIEVVGDNVLPFIREAAESPSLFANSAAALHQSSYYLSIPYGGTRNDLTLEYHLLSKSWWPHSSGAASNQFALLDPVTTPRLYSADPSNKRVHRAFSPDIYQDNDTDFLAYWEGPYLPFREPHLNKRLREIRMDEDGTFTLSMATSFSDDYVLLDGEAWESLEAASTDTYGGSGTFGGSGVFGPVTEGTTEWRFHTPGFGRAFSFRIENQDSRSFEVFSLAAFPQMRED